MYYSLGAWRCCVLILLGCGTLSNSSPIAERDAELATRSTLPLTVNTIFEGSVPTWNENLAVRANGQIMVTRLDSPVLELVDPTGIVTSPVTINKFSSAYQGLLGITETTPDVFYIVAAAPFGSDFVKINGTSSVFKVDMTKFASDSAGVVTTNATITKVTDLPDAGFLNGMTTVNTTQGLVFIADSFNGWVYKLYVNTGAYSIAIDDVKMKFLNTSITNLGVNGLKIRDSYLYWSNSGNPIFSRIPIDSVGVPTGASEVVADIRQVDDFVFRADGVAFMCQNQIESLSAIVGSDVQLVAGNNFSTTLAGVTAGAFGRTSATSNILYLTTNGGLAIPVNGTVVVGGKVAYIDTSSFTGISSS